MILTLDVGNTTVGIGAFADGELLAQVSVPVDELGELAKRARKALPRRKVDGAILGSVNPQIEAVVAEWATELAGRPPLVAGREAPIPITVRVPEPEKVGADRLLAAAAAFDHAKRAVIIVDVGTAITVDAVNSRGEFLGGAIAPGLGLSARVLHSETALLPAVLPGQSPSAIGKNTPEAIASGLRRGLAGLIDRLVEEVRSEVDPAAAVVASGGGLADLASYCRTRFDVVEHLTLHGLLLAYTKAPK